MENIAGEGSGDLLADPGTFYEKRQPDALSQNGTEKLCKPRTAGLFLFLACSREILYNCSHQSSRRRLKSRREIPSDGGLSASGTLMASSLIRPRIRELLHEDGTRNRHGIRANRTETEMRKQIMIRKVQRPDIPDCVRVIRASFQTVADEFGFTEENAQRFTAFATTEERLIRQMDAEHRLMFLDEEDGSICGYYSLRLGDRDECELGNLSVLPEYRHRGIGGNLLRHAMKTAAEHGCTVMNLSIVEENTVLRKWYERCGAVHTGTEKFDFFPFTCGYMKIMLGGEGKLRYRIAEGADRIDFNGAVRLLKTTYWANKRTEEQIRKSMENSSCYGVYLEDPEKLVGFARVISDFATTWYLCDVVIDPEYRHQGLGKALISHIASRPEFSGLRGLLLTRDAHGLYEKYGFRTVSGRAMEKSPERV